MWVKYTPEELGRLLDRKQDSYARVDISAVGATAFWSFVTALAVGLGLGVTTNLGAIFGRDSLTSQIFLLLTLFGIFEGILLGAVLFDRLVFERKDNVSRRKFIYELQIKNGRKLCQNCQRLFEAEAVNCTECGISLVSTVGFHWVEADLEPTTFE